MNVQQNPSTDLVRADQEVDMAMAPGRGGWQVRKRAQEVLKCIGPMVAGAVAVTLGVLALNGTVRAHDVAAGIASNIYTIAEGRGGRSVNRVTKSDLTPPATVADEWLRLALIQQATPTVTIDSFAITSTPGSDLAANAVIQVTMTLNRAVVFAQEPGGTTVDTAQPLASLELDFGHLFNVAGNSNTRAATYSSSTLPTSGSTTYVFEYTVMEGDLTYPVTNPVGGSGARTEGIAIAAGSLRLADGVQVRADGDSTVTLDASTAPAMARNTAHTVAADATTPNVVTNGITFNAPESGEWFKLGEDIAVTVTFDEPVEETSSTSYVNLNVGDGLRTAGLASGEGTTALVFRYTVVEFDQDDDGVTITESNVIGTFVDAAGNRFNENLAPAADGGSNAKVDGTRPRVESMVALGTVGFPGHSTFTFTFSEKVRGFTRGDITVDNGSASDPVETSTGNAPSVFTVAITPTGAGQLTVSIAADRVTDLAGNGNFAFLSHSILVTLSAPFATIAAAGGFGGVGNVVSGVTYINTDTFEVTVTFTEAVTGFGDAGTDISVTGGAADTPSSATAPAENVNRVFTVVITPTADGVVTVQVPAGAVTATGESMAANPASPIASFTIDRVDPKVAEIIVPNPARATSAFPVTIRFSEPVTGFVVGDLMVENGTASALIPQEPTFVRTGPNRATYNAEFTTVVTPNVDGNVDYNVTLNIAAMVAEDRATNGNAAATEAAVAIDQFPPMVWNRGIASAAPSTVFGAFDITVTFSEPVNEFTSMDLAVGNGFAGEPVPAADRASFVVTITPIANGDVTVQVKADSVMDDFGNRGPPALTPASPFRRVVALPVAPGQPTHLQAVGGRNTINLRWRAPIYDGRAEITSYRIEVRPNGNGDWTSLVPNTMGAGTTHAHGGLGDGVLRHYQVFAINAAGTSVRSDTASAQTLAEFVVSAETLATLDVNDDGRITGADANAMYFQLIGLHVDAVVRRTLIAPLLPGSVDRTNQAAVDTAIGELLAADVGAVDVNGDGRTDSFDAQLILNVKSFAELVGDGSPGSGFHSFRRALIRPYLPSAITTDEELRAVVRVIRGL